MTTLERTYSSINHYKGSLLPIYEEVCGDTATYPGVEDGFERYLSRTQFEQPQSVDVKYLTAAPADAAAVFQKFLGGGKNCPDGSLRGRARMNALSLSSAARGSVAQGSDGSVVYVPDLASLYLAWQRFLPEYLQNIWAAHAAVERYMDDPNLDLMTLAEIRRAAGRSEIMASEMYNEVVPLMKSFRDRSWQWISAASQFAKINNFRSLVLLLLESGRSGPSFEEDLEFYAGTFMSAVRGLRDPFDWVKRVTDDVIKVVAPNVRLRWPKETPVIETADPHTFYRLLDQITAWVVESSFGREGYVLEFKWDGFKKRFVAIVPSATEPPLVVRHLLERLKGEFTLDKEAGTVWLSVPVKVISKPSSPVNGDSGGGSGPEGDEPVPVVNGLATAGESLLPVQGALQANFRGGASFFGMARPQQFILIPQHLNTFPLSPAVQ